MTEPIYEVINVANSGVCAMRVFDKENEIAESHQRHPEEVR